MEEHNEENSISAVNSPVKVEEIEDDTRELTATPLKKYITIVSKDGNKWTCNFGCKVEPYTGTYSRVRAHFIGLLPGQRAQGVALCSKVTKEERDKMKKEEDEAKRLFGGCTRKSPISLNSAFPQACKATTSVAINKGKDILDMNRMISKDDVDGAVARFFYGNGIPLNVAKSPFWVDMVRAINHAPKGYDPPSAEKIKTTLLDKEKTKVDQEMMCIKQEWPTYGVSIVADGWMNSKKESVVKVMAVSEKKATFIMGVDCVTNSVSSEFIAEILLKAVESVGAYSVVQILTDDASICKAAGKTIETAYPHIFWSGSVAHTLSLLLKDIIKSTQPSLCFVVECYRKAKGILDYLKTHSSSLYAFRTFSELDGLRVKKRKYGQHFLVLERILRVKSALINMILSEEWEKLKSGRSKAQMDHDDVKKVILDDEFWKKLKITVTFLKPIWNVIHYCDSEKALIGEIYQKIDDMLDYVKKELPDNADLSGTIQKLLDGRWVKTDVPLYCLAYVLTPSYYSDHWLRKLDPAGKKRRKPHADLNVHKIYLDAVDRLVRDPKEASLIRQQLSDFVSSTGFFGRPQASKDRETMSALSWWHLYGASAPELYGLAVKVLSQSVKTSCVERELPTSDYICNVKQNIMNGGRADYLLYVHFNNRLLTRCREDYEGVYKNWDYFLDDDNLEMDMEAIENREYTALCSNHIDSPLAPALSAAPSTLSFEIAEISSVKEVDEVLRGKRPRIR
ncbi:hypothetical protein ACJIZ3_011490 [Penstemon smallii]|uniref:DUF659 domain-containing protein n=1 Tax=Penstemon smallii TaxID=265156 RepID=A0ABD3UM31_9LAMI